jgi:hypothetical protein
VALATPASATDSLAPPGAQHNWLPKEGWVWMHWLPFEEPELAAALGTNAAGLRRRLSDDDHTLSRLAARRGWTTKALAPQLTRRFDGRVRAGVLALLTGEALQGVRTRSQSRAQSRRMLARQRGALDCWMASPLPKLDPANSFGGRDGGPGTAPAGVATPAIPGCQGPDHDHAMDMS